MQPFLLLNCFCKDVIKNDMEVTLFSCEQNAYCNTKTSNVPSCLFAKRLLNIACLVWI